MEPNNSGNLQKNDKSIKYLNVDTNISYHKWSQIILEISKKMTNQLIKYINDDTKFRYHKWSQIMSLLIELK